MKKVLMAIFIGFLCVSFSYAEEKGKAFAAFNNTKGKFVHSDLYIYVIDINGDILAHGGDAKLIGQHMINLKDADGKEFIKAIIDDTKLKNRGSRDYKWTNPLTKKVEKKSTFFERVGDVIIICGYYK
jgi:signal transduction histidine kinase